MTITTLTPPLQCVSDDRELAQALFDVLRNVASLEPLAPNDYPLLDALRVIDQDDGTDRARRLMILGAVVHDHADERRVAEYLLRHRHELIEGRPVRSLIAAARYAAEMDVRRATSRELPVDGTDLAARPEYIDACLDAPSVGDIVIEFLEGATCLRLQPASTEHVRDAVAIAMELAERHALNGGTGPSLIAMRPSARPGARLVTHVRKQLPAPSARSLARVLVGSDGTDIATAALWWAATAPDENRAVPAIIRSRWTRDLQVLDEGCASNDAGTTAA